MADKKPEEAKQENNDDSTQVEVLGGVVNTLTQAVAGMQETFGTTLSRMVDNLGQTARIMEHMNSVMENVMLQNIAISSNVTCDKEHINLEITVKNNNMFPLGSLMATVSFEKIGGGPSPLSVTLLHAPEQKEDVNETQPVEITQTDRLNAHLLGAVRNAIDDDGFPTGMKRPPPEVVAALAEEKGDEWAEEPMDETADNALVVPKFSLEPSQDHLIQLQIHPTELVQSNGTLQIRVASPGTGQMLVVSHTFGIYLWHQCSIAAGGTSDPSVQHDEVVVNGTLLRDKLGILPTQALDVGSVFTFSRASFLPGDAFAPILVIIGAEDNGIRVRIEGSSAIAQELVRLCPLK